MSCNGKISSFYSKANKLKAGLSYAIYKELQFGNTEKAEKYEKSLQDIKSLSWLLDRHEYSTCDCNKYDCLCPGAASDPTFKSEEFITNTLDQNGQAPDLVELWKGVLKNEKSGKLISLSSRALDLYNPACEIINGVGSPLCRLDPNIHKSLRFWEWNGNVPTMVFDTGQIFTGISAATVVSFYYSELHDSYYVRVEDQIDGSLLFKFSSDFSITQKIVLPMAPNPIVSVPRFVLAEVIDSLNYLVVNDEVNQNILVYSLVDLTLIKTISRTGVFFQKMTWADCSCTLFLTGRNDGNPAEVHGLNVATGVISSVFIDVNYRNNTSILNNAGELVVLNYSTAGGNNELVFNVFSACSNPSLLNSVNTGINLYNGGNVFSVIHSMLEDSKGNIILTYIPQGGTTTVSVFDKDFNLKFTRVLGWGTSGTSVSNSWTNTNILEDGTLVIHQPQDGGVGGSVSYYLEYESKSLERIKPQCIVLTDEEISIVTNKLNAVIVPKAYKSLGLNTNIKNIKDCNRLFVYQQDPASVLWTINHNLNTFPVIIAVDNLGNKITGLETYVSKNTVTILFSVPIAGTAYLTYNIQ